MMHHKNKNINSKGYSEEHKVEIPCLACIMKTSDHKHYCLVPSDPNYAQSCTCLCWETIKCHSKD